MEQLRIVWADERRIEYSLIRKRIKNLYLRIREDGSILLSVPMRCTDAQADDFVLSRRDWIEHHSRKMQSCVQLLPEESDRVCRQRLEQAVEDVFPLVSPYGVRRPELKIRTMRAQWGNCHWTQGYITLNRMLYRCPEYLRRYVALHELVHFLYHDHGPGFYAVMDALMPEWKLYRKELKLYAGALRK